MKHGGAMKTRAAVIAVAASLLAACADPATQGSQAAGDMPTLPNPPVAAAASSAPPTTTPLPPQTAAAAKAAVGDALEAHQRLGVPPASRLGKQVTVAGLAADRAAGMSAISAHFTGAAATHEAGNLNSVIQNEQSGRLRLLGGSIRALKFTTVGMSDSGAATVTGSVVTSSEMSLENPDGTWHTAAPHNTLLFTITATKSSAGKWLVQTFDWSFAPGTGP